MINYTTQHPEDFQGLLEIYEKLNWNSLNLTVDELERMCKQSWFAVYAYDEHQLVGMGRVISDGVITALICGVCVLPNYQSQGIGKEIVKRMVQHCEQHRVIPQLMCVEKLVPYYEAIGFKEFSVGMNKMINR